MREALARVSLDAQWFERVTPLALSASRSSTHDCAASSADGLSVPRPPRWAAVAALRHQSRTLQREPRAAGELLASLRSRACPPPPPARASHRLRTQAELMHMCSCFFSACKRSWLALRASGPRSKTSLASAVRTRLALAVSSAVTAFTRYVTLIRVLYRFYNVHIYCFCGPRTRQGSLTDISYQRSFS